MKYAVIITSVINVDNNFPLSYSKTRSFFKADERMRQTVYSVASMDTVFQKDLMIYVLDASSNWQEYAPIFSYQKNLKFIPIKEQFPQIYKTITTHPNKSLGECSMMSNFLKSFKQELKQYDYVFKLSGRYFTDSSIDKNLFNEQNKDKIFYKKPLAFNWNDAWNYSLVDQRKEQGDNKLRQYCSVLHGWGAERYDNFLDLYTALSTMLEQPSMQHMDIETLGYFFTRPLEQYIIETDWTVYGWDGTSGRYMRY